MHFQTGTDALELELHIETDGGGRWRVGVVGRSSVWDGVAPLEDRDVLGIPGLEPSIQTWASLRDRLLARDPPCPASLWLGVGAMLRARLLTPPLEAALQQHEQLAASLGAPLRVAIRMAPDEELLARARLPLERMFHRQPAPGRPAIRTFRAGTTRGVDEPDPMLRARAAHGLLLVAATGDERSEARVDAMEREARQPGLRSRVLLGVTRASLATALDSEPVSVLCLFAPAAEDTDTHGRVWLADGPLPGTELRAMMADVRLAIIAGVDRDPPLVRHASMAVAQHLVQGAGRAAFAVGFRWNVDPDAACALAGSLALRVRGGVPVDQAFAEATADLRRPPSEWAAPALFSRLRDPFASARRTTLRPAADLRFGGAAFSGPSHPGAAPAAPSILPRRPRPFLAGRERERALLSAWLTSAVEPPIGCGRRAPEG